MVNKKPYSRLEVDERRAQLLELGTDLFSEHGYDDLSMARIARAGGVSKALLYHYFPSKRDYFLATMGQVTAQLTELTQPDPDAPAYEQVDQALAAFLDWMDSNSAAYAKLMQSSTSVGVVGQVIATVRAQTAQRILDGVVEGESSPADRAAVQGWLWFMDGACLDWIEHRDIDKDELRALLLRTLKGALKR